MDFWLNPHESGLAPLSGGSLDSSDGGGLSAVGQFEDPEKKAWVWMFSSSSPRTVSVVAVRLASESLFSLFSTCACKTL